MDSLRFSLASDIVELVVLTTDETFLQTLREAVGPSRRLWHVPSPEKVSDLLLAGGVGILVLDVNALRQPGPLFITQIKHQFPDLVIVVAGTRDAETELARLISDGTVYRFIHKPMSPARARLFADAAVKRYEDLRKRNGEATPARAKPAPHGGLMMAGGCAMIFVIAGGIWSLTRGDREPTAPGKAAVPAAGIMTADTAPATPPGATPSTVPTSDSELLLARAQNALLEERLDEAATAIEMARRAGAPSGRITLLTAELAKARSQVKTAADSAHPKTGAAADGSGPALDPADASAALAMQRIREGRLFEPERDSARSYVQEALKSNPGSDAAERASEALALGLLSSARDAISRKDFKAASASLDAADGIASAANIDNLRHLLTTAQRPKEDANAVNPAPAAASVAPAPAALAPTAGAATTGDQQMNAAEPPAPSAAGPIDANRLAIVKSVQPEYPRKAREEAIQGWVEVDFTVAESGQVKDLSVHGANPRGVFDQAALSALSQWRYKPVLVDAKPVAQRARIRIRFALAK
jgi:protein TonB